MMNIVVTGEVRALNTQALPLHELARLDNRVVWPEDQLQAAFALDKCSMLRNIYNSALIRIILASSWVDLWPERVFTCVTFFLNDVVPRHDSRFGDSLETLGQEGQYLLKVQGLYALYASIVHHLELLQLAHTEWEHIMKFIRDWLGVLVYQQESGEPFESSSVREKIEFFMNAYQLEVVRDFLMVRSLIFHHDHGSKRVHIQKAFMKNWHMEGQLQQKLFKITTYHLLSYLADLSDTGHSFEVPAEVQAVCHSITSFSIPRAKSLVLLLMQPAFFAEVICYYWQVCREFNARNQVIENDPSCLFGLIHHLLYFFHLTNRTICPHLIDLLQRGVSDKEILRPLTENIKFYIKNERNKDYFKEFILEKVALASSVPENLVMVYKHCFELLPSEVERLMKMLLVPMNSRLRASDKEAESLVAAKKIALFIINNRDAIKHEVIALMKFILSHRPEEINFNKSISQEKAAQVEQVRAEQSAKAVAYYKQLQAMWVGLS